MTTPYAPKFIWTKRAIEKWISGTADPAHTISAPNIHEVYEGFVSQLRPGTPWALVNGSEIAATGTAGFGITEIRF